MKLIEELKKTENLDGKALDEALLTIKRKYSTPEDKKTIEKYLSDRLDGVFDGIDKIDNHINALLIRQQMGETFDLLPISYIAKTYFGKSASWLHQRISGYSVRGHVYTLNEEEKSTLNRAIHEIGNKFGSLNII